MSDPGLTYRAASHGLELPSRAGFFDVVELDAMSRFVFRCNEATASAVASATGVSLDQPINRATSAGDRASLRVGPDEWLLLINEPSAQDFLAAVGRIGDGHPYSIVDVSHRNVGLGFKGAGVATELATGCPQALEIDRFPVDRCSRTVFAKAEVILWRRAEDRFHMEVWRSFVPYVLALLSFETASLEEVIHTNPDERSQRVT